MKIAIALIAMFASSCKTLVYDRFYEVTWPDASEGAARWVCMRDPYKPKEAVLICTDIVEDVKGPVTEL